MSRSDRAARARVGPRLGSARCATFAARECSRRRSWLCAQDVHPVHGTNMLLINHYKYSAHKKREIATDLVDGIVTAVTDIWSSEDPETLIEAYQEGTKTEGAY